ncbi:MAG: gliding motility-associated C-terminal domain-containing protein [Saprospiraceae bacterium]|nr:gliding motility-associated C-terminal domain-containing protein [Saprospiraceae bacterium]
MNPKGGTGPYTYLWEDGTTSQNRSGLNGGSANVYAVTVTDKNNCSSIFSTTLNVQGSLSLTTEVVKNLSCAGVNDAILRIDILGPITNGPYTTIWTDKLGVVIGNTQTIQNLGPGMYHVEVTDKNNCSNSANITLDEPAVFSIDVLVTNAACNGQNGMAVVNVTGSQVGLTYEWKMKGTSVIIDSDATLNAIAGEYTVTVMNSNNCSKDTTIIIGQGAAITFPAPSTNKVTCFGLSNGQAAIMNPAPGLSFNWSTGEQGFFVINLGVGNYWVVATAGACKSDTTFFDITSFPLLKLDTAKTVLTNPTCFGDNDGSISVEITGGTGIGYKYKWTGKTSTSGTLNNIAAGGYEVIISDDKNCEQKDTLFLTQPDQLIASVDKSKTIELDCNNQTQGKISLMTVGGNAGIKKYTWQAGVDADKETAINLTSGTYCATVSDNQGCKDTVCYTLSAPKALSGELNTPQPPLCNGGQTCISVKFLTGGTGNKYTFQINNGTRYPIDSCVSVFAGAYFINLIDSAGCSIDTIITINQPEPIKVDLGEDQEIQLGLPSPIINAIIDSPVALDTLIWTPQDSLVCLSGNCQTVQLTPSVTTTYLLNVTDQNGCTGSDQLTITVKNVRNVYFANIFSPNSDGNNDYFQPVVGAGFDKILSFAVFDRWGNLVFEKNNYVPDPAGIDGWDGTFQGKKLDPGVFVYYANVRFIDGKLIEYKGSVTIADKVKN